MLSEYLSPNYLLLPVSYQLPDSVQEQFNTKNRALETLHMQASVQLEATYERKLELERATLQSQLAERDDRRFHIEETLQRMRKDHQGLCCTHRMAGTRMPESTLHHLCR